jgi:hypothetical protein
MRSSTYEIKKAFFFFFFVTTWVVLFLLPIHLDPSNDDWKTLHVISSVFPVIVTSIYFLVAFAYVIYNRNPSDDSKINIISFLFIALAWIVSWSSVYMDYWLWYPSSPAAFPILPTIASSDPYEAWVYMLGISAGIYGADQPLISDAHKASLVFLVGVQTTLSIFINIVLFAICVTMTYELIKERNKERYKKNETRPFNQDVYYYAQPGQSFQNPIQMDIH